MSFTEHVWFRDLRIFKWRPWLTGRNEDLFFGQDDRLRANQFSSIKVDFANILKDIDIQERLLMIVYVHKHFRKNIQKCIQHGLVNSKITLIFKAEETEEKSQKQRDSFDSSKLLFHKLQKKKTCLFHGQKEGFMEGFCISIISLTETCVFVISTFKG